MRRLTRRAHCSGRTRAGAVGLLAVAVAAGTALTAPSPADAAPLAGSTPAAAPGHHLSTRLSTLVAAHRADLGPAATADQLSLPARGAGSLLRTPGGQRYVVDVRFSAYSEAAVKAVEAAGAQLIIRSPRADSVTVSVTPQELRGVGDAPGVEYVGEEYTPEFNGVCDTTVSEGDAILAANQLRATGVDGSGVKVGVLSDTWDRASGVATSAAEDIGSDDLPGAANTCGHTTDSIIGPQPGGGSDEGRAMGQIVHDVAPGAAIDFQSASISEPSFAAGITQLADQGAKVIVDDVTYFDEPMYQDGIIEQAVTDVRARDVDYFSSSGNNRLIVNGNEVGSYEAVDGYRPTPCPAIAAITSDHTDCHNFGTGGSPDSTFSYLPANGVSFRAIMNWAEPWAAVNTDLDLYLVDQTTGSVMASSTTVNTGAGSQRTFEMIAGTQNTGGTSDTWAYVVARKSSTAPSAAPRFKIVLRENGAHPFLTLEHEIPAMGTNDVMGPTAFGHNGGADAMSVGASNVQVATALNSYSSYGPVTTLFGPVNGSTPAAPLASPMVVNKPDLVASDCNHTSFFSGASHVFCGTSAAAPHAAAVAALLRQKFPAATAGAINAALIATATPIDGVPATFQGGGLINALAAGSYLTPPPPPPPPAVPDTTLTKAPKKTLRTTKNKVRISFQFTSTIAGATFTCRIDGKSFSPCASGATFKLKPGKHTFEVRATANGATDPTPASYALRVKRKKQK